MGESKFVLVIVVLLIVACKSEPKVEDFTKENEFTAGIEGPATDAEGNIYAVNFEKEGTIGKIMPNGEASLFVELPDGSIGNGIKFGKPNQMFVADYTNHNILEINTDTKEITVFATDSTANQPNDIAITPNKTTLYASDPNWAKSTGKLWKITKEKGFELLEDNMGTTNGVAVSNNGKKLYVNESVQRKIWVYDILENGSIANKKLFTEFADFGLDGMRFHKNGNLFVTRYDKGVVAVFSPEGKQLKGITLKGKKPTNLTFSNDYTKCYVTLADRGCVEVIIL